MLTKNNNHFYPICPERASKALRFTIFGYFRYFARLLEAEIAKIDQGLTLSLLENIDPGVMRMLFTTKKIFCLILMLLKQVVKLNLARLKLRFYSCVVY